MRAAKPASLGVLALVVALAAAPEAIGGYVDCALCHLDPAGGSLARDFSEYYDLPQRQHAVNVSYAPANNVDYRRPTSIDGDITFFDTNGNGVADPNEIQLFGATAKIQCASCHREHGDGTTPPEEGSVYLRVLNASDALCRVCHDL